MNGLRRRARHAGLRGKRRKVKAQTKAIVKRVEHGLSSPRSKAPGHKAAGSVKQLRRTLGGIRHDVLHDGAGRNTKLVASALSDLDRSLAELSRSFATADPGARLRLLADAKDALDKAQAKARKAGHDWPL